jgi:DNA-binding beta-propeller fold protein YncE
MQHFARAAVVAALLAGCGGGNKPDPDRAHLRQPTGLAISPDAGWLFVTNGNWDMVESAGTLMAIDLDAVHAALASSVGAPRSGLSRARPCRTIATDDPTIECDESMFIDSGRTVLVGDAVGNIAVDARSGEQGGLRLLVPQRRPPAVVWLDVFPGGDGVIVDCDQAENGVCAAEHAISIDPDSGATLPGDPARVVIDDQGFRFAYVPHLVGGSLSLIDLDGKYGPELTDREDEFYREDAFGDGVRGGFSVASMACDPVNPPRETEGCTRPFMYTTNRFLPALREFVVWPGLQLIAPGVDNDISPVGTEGMPPRPIMGDLAFEDPEDGHKLLVVQTTPGALARLDTSIDPETERPRNVVEATVPLCSNPNLVTVVRPEGEEALALVSCFSDGVLAVVGLSTFSVLGAVPVGAGANEIAVDVQRRQAYVANTRESTISIVSLDRRDPRFLTEWARLGLDAGSRE